MTRLGLHAPFPILYADDLAASVRFYEELLGFEPIYRWPEDGEPDFVALVLDGRELGIGRADRPAMHGRPVAPHAGLRFELCLTADDVDAAVERLRAAGVRVLLEPADQPWGERLAYVEDPDGNPVHILQAIVG